MTAQASLQSVAELYRDHHDWLHGLLRRRLGCSETAADLAHDAFVRLLARPPSLAGYRAARAYLGSVARGLCIDLWRRREIEQAYLQALAARPVPAYPSAEQQALVIEVLCEVDTMLRRLPPKVAEAFVLAQINGLTYRQVAKRLAVSERMVKKYMAQAMLQCALVEAGLAEQP